MSFKQRIESIADAIVSRIDVDKCARKKLLIIMVGYVGSGKTILANRYCRKTRVLEVSSYGVGKLIQKFFSDYTTNYLYWQLLQLEIKTSLLRRLMAIGCSLVLNSSHVEKEERNHFIAIAREYGYKVIAVEMIINAEDLLRHLDALDLSEGGGRWREKYLRQYSLYQYVMPEETDGNIRIHKGVSEEVLIQKVREICEEIF